MRILVFIFSIFLSTHTLADDCDSWFEKSGLKPKETDCLLKCSALRTDLGTFTCPDQCAKFCTPKKCDKLKSPKVKAGRPQQWPYKNEKMRAWKDSESQLVMRILQAVPEEFLQSLSGIYRLSLSSAPENPGTSFYHQVAIYDLGFRDNVYAERVIVHELAHIYFDALGDIAKDDYKNQAGWRNSAGHPRLTRDTKMRDGAQLSSSEDFAVNAEEYLLSPQHLKEKIPKVFDWFQFNIGKDFKMREVCND
jgi:hypothetical protein